MLPSQAASVRATTLRLQRVAPVITTANHMHGYRSPGWLLDDHRPGEHPRDDKEMRRKAAQKYGLLPDDYRPYSLTDPKPALAAHAHDYPDLGEITYEHRDPYENWTDVRFRRNFGEPVPYNFDIYRPDRITFTGLAPAHTDPKQWLWPMYLAGAAAVISFFLYVGKKSPEYKQPMMPKQYPYDFKRAWPFEDPRKYPITNYTFEPANAPDKHEHH